MIPFKIITVTLLLCVPWHLMRKKTNQINNKTKREINTAKLCRKVYLLAKKKYETKRKSKNKSNKKKCRKWMSKKNVSIQKL